MRKIIHDCDNTLGIKGCDVDDGLALLYLLGCDNVELLGITTTYGNNKLEAVYFNTINMLKTLNRKDIRVFKGGSNAGDYKNEASKFLAKMAEANKGELEILATGSLTNIYGAVKYCPNFFLYVKQIVLMGGITEKLYFEKKVMDELNFSCDPKASFEVLTSGAEISTMTGNNCLKVLFTRDEYKKNLTDNKNPAVRFIKENTDYWFDDNLNDYGIQGFYNWDVTSAVYLIHPEIFDKCTTKLCLSETDLKTGYLKKSNDASNAKINLPEIANTDYFRKTIYSTWQKAKINYS